MKRVWPFLLLIGAAQPRNAAIALPDDTGAFPKRAGVEEITGNCTGCHSPSMILTQPHLTTAEWQGEIKKMKDVYKAPVNPADEPAILSYLIATSDALPH